MFLLEVVFNTLIKHIYFVFISVYCYTLSLTNLIKQSLDSSEGK